MKKRALVSGITGQDGSYLAELLLEKGYEVHGIIRRSSSINTGRIDYIYDKIKLHYGDMSDSLSLDNIIFNVKPDEIYNLAAQSHVRVSFDIPEYTGQVDALGTLKLLEAARKHAPNAKIYNACHDTETKIVSEKGIVNYEDLSVGDLVYTFNIESKKMELKPIKRKIDYHYKGNMIHFKNRRIDQLVTPNHNMIFTKDDGCNFYIVAEDVENELKYDNISHLSLPIPKTDEEEIININFEDYVNFEDISKNHTKNLIYNMSMNDFLYLLGCYIGDGYMSNDKKLKIKTENNENLNYRDNNGRFINIENELIEKVYKSSYINFAIPKTDTERKEFTSVLDRNNIEYKEHDMTVEFSSFTLSKMFSLCGESVYDKKIPNWVLDLPSNNLFYLKKGLIGTDGHIRKKDNRESYTTTSKTLIKDMIVLSYKLGEYCSMSVRSEGTNYIKCENRSVNAREAYDLRFNKRKTNKIYLKNINKVEYDDIVWCLEMEDNHNFLIVRNGKIGFSGNCTSELFGLVQETPQKETTPFYPRSPYGVSKLYSYWICKNYRESYNMFISNGILFNHEGERRGETFVTRKITIALSKIVNEQQDFLELGNLDSFRDWGYAPDYVEGMWRMLQQDKPDDFVLATNETHSIREFIEESVKVYNEWLKERKKLCLLEFGKFQYIDLEWQGTDENEIGYCKNRQKAIIKINPKYYRPAEVDLLLGDPSKAKELLGWTPTTKFKELVKKMMIYDLNKKTN